MAEMLAILPTVAPAEGPFYIMSQPCNGGAFVIAGGPMYDWPEASRTCEDMQDKDPETAYWLSTNPFAYPGVWGRQQSACL